MNVLFTLLAILVIIAAILITIVVLLQNGKGGGLASNFVAGNQTFGVRQTADILEKITWGLAVVILLLSIASNFASHGKVEASGIDKKIIEQQEAAKDAAFPASDEVINLSDAEAATEATTETAAETK